MLTTMFHKAKAYAQSIAMRVFPWRGRDNRSSRENSLRFEESSNEGKAEPSDAGSPVDRKPDRLPEQNSAEAVSPHPPKETESDNESSNIHPNLTRKTGNEVFQPSSGAGSEPDADQETDEQSANACEEPATKDSNSPDDASAIGISSDERDQRNINRDGHESESKFQADSIESGSAQAGPTELPPGLPDDADKIEVHETGAQTGTPNEAKTREPKTPLEIGGRRSKGASPVKPDRSRETITRPELQCRKTSEGGAWEIVISANEDCQVKSILHGENPLQLVSGTCSLQSLNGKLSIVLQNGVHCSITLFVGNPLVFKLSKDWSGVGRSVREMTKGHYIVFAPGGWKRTGHVPVEPNACTDEEFTAHYFYVDGTPEAEESEGFREFAGRLRAAALELTGKRIFDDSEDGDLFVDEVPSLPRSKEHAWARVGEESPDGWHGDNFKPSESDLASVLRGRQGRFFARVYNAERMLDSIQFRYLRDLKEILLNGEPYSDSALLIPPPDGHDTTNVRFVGIDESQTRLRLHSPSPHVEVRGSSLYIAPHPTGDCVSCMLDSGTGSVGIELKLPRVWWRLERNSVKQSEWRDTPFGMARDEFIERAHAGWSVRMRVPPRIKSVGLGFGGQRKSEHQLRSNCDTFILDEFVDNECIADIQYADRSFEAEVGGTTITLIRMAADPIPEIVSFSRKPKSVNEGGCAKLRWETRNFESGGVFIEPEIGAVEFEGILDVVPEKTTKYTLRLAARGIDDVTRSITVAVQRPLRTIEAPCAIVRNAREDGEREKDSARANLKKRDWHPIRQRATRCAWTRGGVQRTSPMWSLSRV